MRKHQVIILFVVAAGVAAVAGTLTGRYRSANRERPPTLSKQDEVARLSVPEDRLDIGTIWESEQFTLTLPIENQEPFPVEVESFSATCNCLSIEPRSFSLGSGERRELRLQLDLATKPPPNGVVDVRLTAKLKQETSSGKRLGPDWMVSGRVRRTLSVEPLVYLGRHSELAQPIPPKTVQVEALAPLASLTARSEVPGVMASVVPPASGSSAYTVVLVSPTSLPVGAVTGSVILTAVSQGGESLPPRQIDVRVNIVPDLEAQPTAMQVGGRRIGEMFEEVVTLRSLAGRPIGTIHAEAEGEGLTVEPTEAMNEFRVRQVVRQTGSRSGCVRFSADIAGQRRTVILPVEYVGIGGE